MPRIHCTNQHSPVSTGRGPGVFVTRTGLTAILPHRADGVGLACLGKNCLLQDFKEVNV